MISRDRLREARKAALSRRRSFLLDLLPLQETMPIPRMPGPFGTHLPTILVATRQLQFQVILRSMGSMVLRGPSTWNRISYCQVGPQPLVCFLIGRFKARMAVLIDLFQSTCLIQTMHRSVTSSVSTNQRAIILPGLSEMKHSI